VLSTIAAYGCGSTHREAIITAGDVLVATNGYTDACAPWPGTIIPIGSYIIATEPLGDARAADVSPQRRMMSDTRNFLHYWRLSPDDAGLRRQDELRAGERADCPRPSVRSDDRDLPAAAAYG